LAVSNVFAGTEEKYKQIGEKIRNMTPRQVYLIPDQVGIITFEGIMDFVKIRI